MPDWTYQTVFRPALFRLGPQRGRRVALGAMGWLSRLPLGKAVIRLMGHMQPDPRVVFEHKTLTMQSRVGLGCALDPEMAASAAFEEFGFGFLEIGPIVAGAPQEPGEIRIDARAETLQLRPPVASLDVMSVSRRLKEDGPFRVPVFARIESASSDEICQILRALRSQVTGFIVPVDQLNKVRGTLENGGQNSDRRPTLLVAVNAVDWQDVVKRDATLGAVRDGWLDGVVVAGEQNHGAVREIGRTGFGTAVETARLAREELGRQPLVIGAVGIHSPADALDYLDAGADLVQIDSGLVFAGPGLPKRINEAVLFRNLMSSGKGEKHLVRVGSESWFWAFLMGLSMLVGGLISMIVATTRVVLPYDEAMSGLTRRQLAEINERLLSFMAHDRVSLAGTMLALGILYATLAWWGIRRGVHWAYLSVVVSAVAGFCSFFSFLGFGYFDPFHAFVTAVLFQFLVMTFHADLPARLEMELPDLWNDIRWKAGQWGQLLFVIHGAVLVTAGMVISIVGMTTVFVQEDLDFMGTTAKELIAAHPQLLPLVAHDRATFGGMLLSCGAVTLLASMWGFRRGQAWLWGALMIAGTIAYGSTLMIHMHVGYHSLKHLIPAYGGFALLWTGGIASYGYLVAADSRLEAEWNRRLARTARD